MSWTFTLYALFMKFDGVRSSLCKAIVQIIEKFLRLILAHLNAFLILQFWPNTGQH